MCLRVGEDNMGLPRIVLYCIVSYRLCLEVLVRSYKGVSCNARLRTEAATTSNGLEMTPNSISRL